MKNTKTGAKHHGGGEGRIERAENLELIRGSARFTGPKTLSVTSKESEEFFEAERIFINTGTRPAVPPIDEVDNVPHLDNESIMELGDVPEHLLVLGGGYIGVEFAQMFRRFGSRVTIVQRGGQLLSLEDDDIAEEVLSVLQDDGVELNDRGFIRANDRLETTVEGI